MTQDAFSCPLACVLDFTHGGKWPGAVTSQPRMKDIELVVNPLGGIGVSEMLSFGCVGWIRVNLLVRSYLFAYPAPF